MEETSRGSVTCISKFTVFHCVPYFFSRFSRNLVCLLLVLCFPSMEAWEDRVLSCSWEQNHWDFHLWAWLPREQNIGLHFYPEDYQGFCYINVQIYMFRSKNSDMFLQMFVFQEIGAVKEIPSTPVYARLCNSCTLCTCSWDLLTSLVLRYLDICTTLWRKFFQTVPWLEDVTVPWQGRCCHDDWIILALPLVEKNLDCGSKVAVIV